ncbi:mitochondrial carrier [Phellopilus nigrolimitatus]|nr:mitochondrial carrier [Phellopilus nigrolimitatus]
MSNDSIIHAVAGSAGGVVAMTATYPLIVLSTRAAVETSKEHKSTYQAVLDIVKREGVSGLYSGLGPSLLGIAITNGVYYYFYERSREAILRSRKGGKALSTPESMLIGLIAGSATTIISNPIWVIQTSQTVRTAAPSTSSTPPDTKVKKLSILETINQILQEGGVGAFWRGLGPALVLVVNPVLQYTVFEQLKNLLIKRRTARLRPSGNGSVIGALTDLDFFLLGALSKLVATSATYPYIVIKSRLHAGSAAATRYKSALDGLLTVVREEGVAALYRGVGSKLTQSVLTAALLFAGQRRIYELVKKTVQTVSVA